MEEMLKDKANSKEGKDRQIHIAENTVPAATEAR